MVGNASPEARCIGGEARMGQRGDTNPAQEPQRRSAEGGQGAETEDLQWRGWRGEFASESRGSWYTSGAPAPAVWEAAPDCEGVRPSGKGEWAGIRAFPIITGRSWTGEELKQGRKQKPAPMRVVVWYARMGLGNSLRGLINTFFFALLSGRQLLVSEGGKYGASVSALFLGFSGGLDRTDLAAPRLPSYEYYKPVLVDGRPAVQGDSSSFEDKTWYADSSRRACVYAALQCSSPWCVHGRIVHLMIGEPKEALGGAIGRALRVAPRSQPQGHNASASRRRLASHPLQPLSRNGPSATTRRGLVDWLKLDLFLGSYWKRRRALGKRGMHTQPNRVHMRDSTEVSAYSRQYSNHAPHDPTSGSKLGPHGGSVTSGGSWQAIEDQPLLRPTSARRLLQAGKVDPESGVSGGAVDADAALRLKFDVAIHVRTFHKCIEGYKHEDFEACHGSTLAASRRTLEAFPELSASVLAHRWSCVSGLLAFLMALKGHKAQLYTLNSKESIASAKSNTSQRGLFQEDGDEALLRQYLASAARHPGRRPLDAEGTPTVDPRRGDTTTLWSVEDAKYAAEQWPREIWNRTSKEGPQSGAGDSSMDALRDVVPQGLSIFLATDSESLRPLFVEFLRPFGDVAFSAAGVVHLAHKDQANDEQQLSTLGEFYLLSRGSVVLSYTQRNSSYAHMAALYGNATLIQGCGPSRCNFPVSHIARVM